MSAEGQCNYGPARQSACLSSDVRRPFLMRRPNDLRDVARTELTVCRQGTDKKLYHLRHAHVRETDRMKVFQRNRPVSNMNRSID